jgi:hypothetical protein
LSYPSIIIASITGVGGFAVLNPSGNVDVEYDMATRIMVVQYFFAFLNVLGGILTSVSKFGQSANLEVAHSAMCKQYSKYYRNIDMELSLDVTHRADITGLLKKCRTEYDRFLDEAPDIPSISVKAFNTAFPNKENKPDVCNGLSIINCDANSDISTMGNPISRWLSSVKNIRVSRRSIDVNPQNSNSVL